MPNTAATSAFASLQFLYEPVSVPFIGLSLLLLSVGMIGIGLYLKIKRREVEISILKNSTLQKDKALDSLAASEEKYRTLFNLTLAGIFRISTDGDSVLAANTAAVQIFGYHTEEEAIQNIRPKEMHATTQQREMFLTLLARDKQIEMQEAQFFKADGTIFDAVISAAINLHSGTIEGTIIDITESKRAERLLRESSTFQQNIIDAIPVPIFYKDTAGTYRLINKAFTNATGLRPEQALGRTLDALWDREIIEHHLIMDQALFAAKGPASQQYEAELRFLEEPRNVLFYKELVYINGARKGIIGSMTDITARKQQEETLASQQALLSSLVASISDMVFFKDTEGRYLGCNDAFAEHLNRSPQDILGKTEFDLYEQEYAANYSAWDKQVLEEMRPIKRELTLPVNGAVETHEVIKVPILTEDKELLGVAGTARNITTRKEMENTIREAELRYRNIFERSVEGLYTAKASGEFLEVNPAMAQLFGYDRPEDFLDGVKYAQQVWCTPEDRKALVQLVQEVGSISGHELCVKKQNGEEFWISLGLRAIHDKDGALQHFEGIAVDITQKRLTEHELALRASTDSLTGLANRAKLENELERMLAQAQRSGIQIGLLFIDLDGFKPINDTYGHAAGDEVLFEVGKRIGKRIRGSDIAGRLGGDEFVILLWNINGEESIYRIGRDILSVLNVPFTCSQFECRLGASIGGSMYPAHGKTSAELLRTADNAMYQVKRYGKNALRVAGPDDSCSPGE